MSAEAAREHRDRRDELAAYALGALDERETAELERHLEGCDRCREHLRWLDPALEVLSESVQRIEPSPGLRERLMGEVRADAEMRAAIGPAAASRPRSAVGDRWRRLLLRPAVGLAGVAIVAAGIAGWELRGEDYGIETTPVVRSGEVTASIERMGDAGTLQVAGLKQLGTGQVYQAWVQHGAEIVPSSLFAARRDGTASAAIPHYLEGADAVMVTVEPRGGSTQPGSEPVVNLALRE